VWVFSTSESFGTDFCAFNVNWLVWNHLEMFGNTRLNTHKIIVISMRDKDPGEMPTWCNKVIL